MSNNKISNEPISNDPMSNDAVANAITQALAERFGERIEVDPALPGLSALEKIAAYRSHRRFLPRAIEPELLRLLCACALSAPSKSDLQQSDIVIVGDMTIRQGIVATIPDMTWINDAPAFLVFVANGERLPHLSKLRAKPFPNDHLDQFFNAVVDSAIVLSAFIGAATAIGLGCCPISAIRDHPGTVSKLLQLPERTVPVAGLCVGWPAQAGEITPRLSLKQQSFRIAIGLTILPQRSMRTTGAGPRSGPIAASVTLSAGEQHRSMAGRRTRRGNTPCRPAPILASSSAARDFGSTDPESQEHSRPIVTARGQLWCGL